MKPTKPKEQPRVHIPSRDCWCKPVVESYGGKEAQ